MRPTTFKPWKHRTSIAEQWTQYMNVTKKTGCIILLLILMASTARAEEQNGVLIDVLAKTNSSWDGAKLPAYSSGVPEITILKIKIQPGVQLQMHKHPVINAGVLLRGELTVITEKNEILNLKTGDSIIEVVDKWHYGKNEGNEPAELIVFYAGIVDKPITLKK